MEKTSISFARKQQISLPVSANFFRCSCAGVPLRQRFSCYEQIVPAHFFFQRKKRLFRLCLCSGLRQLLFHRHFGGASLGKDSFRLRGGPGNRARCRSGLLCRLLPEPPVPDFRCRACSIVKVPVASVSPGSPGKRIPSPRSGGGSRWHTSRWKRCRG